MEPVRLLQIAVALLVLPAVLGLGMVLLTSLLAKGVSDPTAAGGLATAAAVLIGVMFVGAFAVGALLGALALVWGALKGQLGAMQGWVIGFGLVLAAYGLGVLILSRGPRL